MQLTFDIQQQEEISFSTFYPGSNVELICALQEIVHSTESQLIYCWGANGVGLSHLLQSTCNEAGRLRRSALYLPLKEMKAHGPIVLQGLQSLSCVCIDDIEFVAGDEEWEEGLFHCFNQMRDAGSSLVVASHYSLAQCPIQLADLRSRLAWGATYQVKSLSDQDLTSALRIYAKSQGFELSHDVVSYLLNHYPRDIVRLKSLLQKLAQASLVQKHKITIPFVKSTLSK